MSTFVFSLFLVVSLALGGLLLLAMLLYHRRTRMVGAGLSVVGLVVLVVGLGGGLLWLGVSDGPPLDNRQVAFAEDEAAVALRKPNSLPADGDKSVKPPPAHESKRPEEPPGVVTAVGKSLARGASETASDSSVGRASQRAPSALLSMLQALARAIKWEDKRPGSGNVAKAVVPDWVEAEPGRVGDVYQATAAIGPYTSREECDQAEPIVVREIAAEYAEKQLNLGAMHDIQLSEQCLQHLKKETWEEEQVTDFGPGIGKKPMFRRYLRLEFDEVVNRELERQGREAKIRRRLRGTGIGLAAVLGALGLAFGYLKINAATRGRHRGRLRASVLAIILGTIAAGALF